MLTYAEQSPRLAKILILVGVLLVGLVLRLQYITFESNDYRYFLSSWVMHIRLSDIAETSGVSQNNYNYAPLYSYLLGAFDMFAPKLYPLYTVKMVSFIGEAFAAYWVFKIMALYSPAPSNRPVITVALLLLCPSVIDNGSITGQCDIWLAGFMLAALYYSMTHQSTMAFIYGGLAIAFKPQAIFMSPFLLVLMLRKDLNWKQLWIIPAVYATTCVPAWIEGRSMHDLLTIYWSQVRGDRVSYSAANFYYYLNGNGNPVAIIHAGEIIAACAACLLAFITYRYWRAPLTPLNCLLLANLFACVMPFTLPLMHDRYFFMADIFSLMLACMQPRWFFLPVLLQSASLIALPASQFPHLSGLPGWLQSLGMDSAIWMNSAAIVIALGLCYRNLWTSQQKIGTHNA